MSLAGKTVSHYQILDQIGSGGMGVVYRARDTVLDREVALKFLPQELSRDEEANQRFMREARAASGLEHPNICTIYEVGTSDEGQLFIAMPFYRGQTLKYQLRDDEEGTRRDAVSIARQVAEGLAAAHEEGIVHRDIKPDNIMITDRGRAVILDFGLATLPGALSLTRAGSTVGTAAYMAPEQVQGGNVGPAADLWSLGVVLYQMLAGIRPFEGDYDQALAYAIVNTDPAPISGLAPDVQVILDRLLEKDPQNRFGSAGEFLEALGPAAPDSDSGEGHREEYRKAIPASSKPLWITVGLVVVAAIVVGLFIVRESRSPQPVATLHSISVLPFAVRGNEDLQYLGEGLVDLLSLALDGAGDIRTVDPNSVIGRIEKDGLNFRTPEEAANLAARLGSSLAVLGRVNSIGSRIQLSATVYDSDAKPLLEAKADAESEDGLQAAVERIASQIVSGVLGLESDEVAIQAVSTTESIDALKSYLTGEQDIRRGRFRPAVEALQAAVAADSLFALAWQRLGYAAGWGIDVDIERDALEHAYRLRDRMPERFRIVTEANHLGFQAGQSEEATDLLLSLLVNYPNDLMALQLLGEIIYHTNPTFGHPSSEALEYFQRAVDLAPDHGDNMIHLIDIANDLGEVDRADSLTRAFIALDTVGSQETDMLKIIRVVIDSGGVPPPGSADDARKKVFERLDRLDVVAAWNVIMVIATEPENLDASRELMQAVADRRDASQAVRDFFGSAISQLDLSQGRYQRFVDYDRTHPDAYRAERLLTRGVVLSTPTYPASRQELLDVRAEVASWDTTRFPPKFWIFDMLEGQKEAARQYLLAMLALRLEDEPALQRSRAALDKMATTRDGTDAAFVWLRSVDAATAFVNGANDTALQALNEAIHRTDWRENQRHLIKGLRNNIFLKAEILARQGHLEEALRTYESLRSAGNFTGMHYYGLVYYRMGQIYERMGKIDDAMDMYSRLMKLWANADPQYKPYVEEAAESLDRLAILKAREPA